MFSHNFIEVKNNQLQCSRYINYNLTNNYLTKNFIFIINMLFQEGKPINKYLRKIRNEPVDALIKYIDLTDKTLRREGIMQIYKDKDNEELRYCIRSILQYIPWIRKIFILMPNEKVKFLKCEEEIREKIIYIKDKDLLGYDTANIHSFTFNLYKMEKYGISKNFIYFEDDFFVGKVLNKNDFFYYDEKEKKVIPYILTFYFYELNKTNLLDEYDNMSRNKDLIHPHSGEGWEFSTLSTKKYFIEKYEIPIINTKFTHNAIPQNLNDVKQIFDEIKEYKYINETLFSKERHILTLNQPTFYNLYLLNIKHRLIHCIPYQYIKIELINKFKLNKELFVINTGGNHIPLERQYNMQKKIMNKRYPFRVIYESRNKNIKTKYIYFLKMIFIINLKIFIIISLLKIFFSKTF